MKAKALSDQSNNECMQHPIWVSVASVLVIPLFAVGVALLAILMIALWPVIPFMVYIEAQKQLQVGLSKRKHEAI